MDRMSVLAVPPTESVTVALEEVAAMLAAVMSLDPWKVTLAPLVLNRQPSGAVRIRVLLLPTAKSVIAPSVMTMLPKAVKPGPLVELRDLSVEIFWPPVGEVMDTLARSWLVCKVMAN